MKKLLIIIIISLTIISCKKDVEPINNRISVQPKNSHWHTIWKDLNSDLISITFPNKDTGYVVTYNDIPFNQSLLTTFDGGKAWSVNIINTRPDSTLFSNIISSDNCLYGEKYNGVYQPYGNYLHNYPWSNGLFKAIKGLKNWKPILTKLNSMTTSNIFDSLNIQSIICNYSETNDNNGLFSTFDGGINWQKLLGFKWGQRILDLTYISRSTGFIMYFDFSTNLITICITKDGGISWIKSVVNLIIDFDVSGQIQYLNENVWYLVNKTDVGRYDRIFRTIDGGKTWKQVSIFTLPQYNGELFNSRLQFNATGNSRSLKRMWFIDPEIGYYHNRKNIYKTMDGGQTWQTDFTLMSKPIYANIVGMVTVKTGEVYVITDCGEIIKRDNN